MGFVQLSSGGKDSIYSLYLAMEQGISFSTVLTMIPKRDDSYMFHYPNVKWARLQTESMGLEHIEVITKGEKEKELNDLRSALETMDVEGVCSGAIKSKYQYERIKKICDDLGLECVAPLWQCDEHTVLKDVSGMMNVMIVGVYAWGLGKELLGRTIDEEVCEMLIKAHERYGVNLAGEGGEYESFVTDAPIFRKKIEIVKKRIVWENDCGHLCIDDAVLVPK